MTLIQKLLKWFSHALAILSLAASAGLIIRDMGNAASTKLSAAAISAAPLLLVGVAFLAVQPLLRPRWSDLLKNVLLAGAFLLWGTIQFLPESGLSRRLGSLVIVLYVVDLAWMTLSAAIRREEN